MRLTALSNSAQHAWEHVWTSVSPSSAEVDLASLRIRGAEASEKPITSATNIDRRRRKAAMVGGGSVGAEEDCKRSSTMGLVGRRSGYTAPVCSFPASRTASPTKRCLGLLGRLLPLLSRLAEAPIDDGGGAPELRVLGPRSAAGVAVRTAAADLELEPRKTRLELEGSLGARGVASSHSASAPRLLRSHGPGAPGAEARGKRAAAGTAGASSAAGVSRFRREELERREAATADGGLLATAGAGRGAPPVADSSDRAEADRRGAERLAAASAGKAAGGGAWVSLREPAPDELPKLERRAGLLAAGAGSAATSYETSGSTAHTLAPPPPPPFSNGRPGPWALRLGRRAASPRQPRAW